MGSTPLSWQRRYVAFIQRRLGVAVGLVVALTVLPIPLLSGLQLKSSMKELLPKDSPSVKALDRVSENVGSLSNITVAVLSPDKKANQKFVDDFVAALGKLPPGEVRYVDYGIRPLIPFFEKYGLLYLSRGELEKVKTRIGDAVAKAKAKANPLYVSVLDDDNSSAFDLESIIGELKQVRQLPIHTVDGYYGGEEGRLLLVLIRPMNGGGSIDHARKLVAMVQKTANDLEPQKYNAEMKVGLTGGYYTSIDEYDALKDDIVSTALLCVALVVGVIILYFLRIRPALLLGATLVSGVLWTIAATRVTIGYLNSQTAFLGSIVVGTGINYGIILLGRYYEERRRGLAADEAMAVALEMTFVPTLVAASATALAFGVLVLAGVRSLTQFAFIGGGGIMLCFAATIIILPILVLALERVSPTRLRLGLSRVEIGVLFEKLGIAVEKWPGATILINLALLAIAVAWLVPFAPNAIEYDFTKMRNRVSTRGGADWLDRRIGKQFRYSTVATAMHLDSADDALAARRAIEAKIGPQRAADRYVSSATTIHDALPPNDLDDKRDVLAAIDQILSDPGLEKADQATRDRIARVRDGIAHPSVTLATLPDELARGFTDLKGRRGTLLFINPVRGRYFSDGHALLGFAHTLRGLSLPDGRPIVAAGDPTVFADLLEIISRDAPKLTIIAFLVVVVLVFASLRNLGTSLVVLGSLVIGILMMAGGAAALDLKINFFNFIILPLTIGIAVDYALNVAVRLRRDPDAAVGPILRHAGGSVALCSLTTIIGYWVLTTANNLALASFGKAAIVGEVTCLFTALTFVPAVMVLRRRKRQATAAVSTMGEAHAAGA